MKERLRILRELDVDAALKGVASSGFIPDTREIALAGIHKARIVLKQFFTEEQIDYSTNWLIDNGYDVPE